MRLRSDLKFGTITDNPLTVGATSVNSAQFATLPTVAGSDELYLTLDPEGSNREIVKVSAHSAAATVCTVARGQLGTTAAQHDLTTRWVHGFVTTDVVVPCTSSTRPTLGLWAGMTIYETDTDRIYNYSGSAWVYVRGGQDPTAARMWRSAAFSLTVSASVPTLIPFDSESYDYGSNASTSTGRYTCPTAGLFSAIGRIDVVSVAAAERFIGSVFKNAAEASRGTDVTDAGGTMSVVVDDGIACAAGDVLDMRVHQVNGSSRAIGTGEVRSYLTIRRVSG